MTFTDTLRDNQVREEWYPQKQTAKCLSCGGRVERYAMDLGCCETCGREWYMGRHGRKGKYSLRLVP